jgi:Transposase DDE domain group 1
MPDLIPMLPGLSPVAGKSVVAKFDGGHLSSDGGLLLLREVEQRLQVAERLAACIKDPLRRTRSLTVWPTSSAFAC